MKKIFIGIGGLLFVGAVVWVMSRPPQPDTTTNTPDSETTVTNTNSAVNSADSTNSDATLGAARYVPYTTGAEAAARAAGETTVLYFHADWCPICRVLDPNIKKNISSLPNGLTILKVDYDRETALKKRYGVTYQHTFVQVDEQGNKLKLWSGSTDARAIADQLL